MNSFLLLFLAIACEICGSTALKASQGFTRLGPVLLVGLGYSMAFYLMSLSLKQIPLSTAYAIWSGVGTVGTVLIGVLLFRESLHWGGMVGMVMTVTGVIILSHFSTSHP